METRFEEANTAFAVTYTTNEPSVSTVATVADGDAVASNEIGAVFLNMQAQIDELRAAINAGL